MSEIHNVNILVHMSAFSHVFFDITQIKGCDCAMPELRAQNRLRVNCIFSHIFPCPLYQLIVAPVVKS